MTGIVAAALIFAASPIVAGCAPADCLRAIQQYVPSAAAEPMTTATVAGLWRRGGGMGGAFLYLLSDRTYALTEWSDLSVAERVADTGKWDLLDGVIQIVPEAAPPGDKPRDRRYLPVKLSSDGTVILIGLDVWLSRSFQLAATLPETPPSGWLAAGGFKRDKAAQDVDTSAVKSKLSRRRDPKR